jgi:hypothetical protein
VLERSFAVHALPKRGVQKRILLFAESKNFSEVGRVGPTPRPVTGMGETPGACSALAELVVFLFVAGALASPAREVGRVFLVLKYSY